MQGVKIALLESLSASTVVRATVPGLALESEDAAQYTVVVHRAEGADIGWMCHPPGCFSQGETVDEAINKFEMSSNFMCRGKGREIPKKKI